LHIALLGYSVEEWLSVPNFWLSIIDKDRIASASAASFASGEGSTLEFRWIDKDGRAIWVESSSVVVRDDEGRPAGLCGVTIDITKRKMIEEQFRQAQKMEAIGQLAGGVAHDFNNLLTDIIGYSHLTLASLNKNDPLRSHIEEIQSSGSRTASLTNQLPIFSRKQVFQPRVLDLNSILLVEDEYAVRNLARRILQKNGYTVLEANNSGEALPICEQYKGLIHLMITDVVLPQMSDQQLVKRLAPLRPEMKTLYMSGYSDDTILHTGLPMHEAFLRKPFMPDSLSLKVREALSNIK
jgi:PAS domain S-box-containing protein